MEGLSILIPTYNDCCTTLVSTLQGQAETLGIDYEIIVADDGSTDEGVKQKNATIIELPHVYYLSKEKNCGRSAIRNFLTQQAHYAWLLFVDGDMGVCRHDFLRQYTAYEEDVVDGGVTVKGIVMGNLRNAYEQAAIQAHTAERRQANPYHDFHTANFMIRRELMLRFPFDERYRHYGYEDVAFGIMLKDNGIYIRHIDNPVSFEAFEGNESFLAKTEEGLRTLHHFRYELHDYSRLLQSVGKMPDALLWGIRQGHRLLGASIRRILAGKHPSLMLFKVYKLGYYLSYAKTQSS